NFFDYDGDGWLDVIVANGHILDNVHLTLPATSYEQEPQLFRNLGNGRFEDRSRMAGPAFLEKRVGRGAAFGDYDDDGDVDVLVSQSNRPAVLLRNEVGNRNHYLLLELRGRRRNLHAIGARVRITAADLVQVEEVRTGTSYLSQNDLRLHFGLGSRDRVDRVEIRWPNGYLQTLPGESIALDAVTRILEPEESPSLTRWRR
ncbi:MAG: CRTAC1 family protein, partial [Acidobacteria bacterium]|nr:CRTAC1 family protein [Acidobacteriota bacterium]